MSGMLWIEESAGVVLIKVAAPPDNALDETLLGRLIDQIWACQWNFNIRALVITGEGEWFCAGEAPPAASEQTGRARSKPGRFAEMLAMLRNLRVPVIAAVNGHANGGGLDLALACDIRVGSTKARFFSDEVSEGLLGPTYRLARLIGVARANAMLLTGSAVDAETALSWGLITTLAADELLETTAVTLAERIASRAPLSVEVTKFLVAEAFDMSPRRAAAAAAKELAKLKASRDRQIALDAARDRRDPVFTRT